MRAARVRVAIHSRMNHEKNGVPDKLTVESIDPEFYIIFGPSIVDKIYYPALEFMHNFKSQEDAIQELMKTGVAEFDFYGYNKFTIEERLNMDTMYARMLDMQKEYTWQGNNVLGGGDEE